MFILPLLAGLAVQAAAKPVYNVKRALPVVSTTYGDVQGIDSPYRDGVTVYRGIPYANTTAGENRWKAPTATSWDGTLIADTFGPVCAQPANTNAGIFATSFNTSSEDCLSLNIWTPEYNDTSDLTSKNLPVYFWIYGGRFEMGSGDVPTYDGTGLATKDIIVVTMNYRVGAFGFLAHPDLSAESGHNASGNYALLDQQFALKWVVDNIANFGGNPKQIVVGGQSAGSASALDTMLSPLSADMIAGVIAESGARDPYDPMVGGLATAYRTKAAAEADGVSFLSTMNVSSIAELRALDVADLIAEGVLADTTYDGTAISALGDAYMNPPLWRPVIDGYVLPYTYLEALASGNHADVPILTGGNKDESGASTDPGFNLTEYISDFTAGLGSNFSSTFFSLYPADNDTQANDMVNEFYRDQTRLAVWLWAQYWSAGGATSPVYPYYFTKTPAEQESAGAYHGSELWYTFNNIPYSDYDNVTWTDYDFTVESIMSTYWANFIKTGNPNGDGVVDWPAWNASSMSTMWLGESFGADYLTESEARTEFIEEWFESFTPY